MNLTLHKVLASALLLLAFPLAAADHHADTPSFRSINVAEQLWMLQGKGGNLAVFVGEQGILLVDDDYKVMSDALQSELQRYGGLDQLTYIVNTHWHGDHTGGNLALGEAALIVAHENVRTRLLTAQEIKLFKMVSEPYPEIALPEITYESSLSLHINGEEVELLHYPNGHTDGDTIVFFNKANVVHMGDHFFSGFFPFVDVAAGGNVLQMAANIKSVIARINDETKVIPGHGPLSSKADLADFHEMLLGTSNEVAAMVEQGLALDEIRKAGLTSRWDSWTDGFLSADVWIGILYNSLLP